MRVGGVRGDSWGLDVGIDGERWVVLRYAGESDVRNT